MIITVVIKRTALRLLWVALSLRGLSQHRRDMDPGRVATTEKSTVFCMQYCTCSIESLKYKYDYEHMNKPTFTNRHRPCDGSFF